MDEEQEILLLNEVLKKSFDFWSNGGSPGRLCVGDPRYPYEPYPWLSFGLQDIVGKPEQFRRLLDALGHWNGERYKVGRGEWGLFPVTVTGHRMPTYVSWILQPREINDCRSPEVLTRLRRETQELAEYLEAWAKANP